ncbi:laminin subunit alpha-like [Tachypleus tridentatus]|uniref:laminin subunit alpha-like n=1 Tax=Tachypleus tridentatus TaxID=6853 RepID=UPI003FCF971D
MCKPNVISRQCQECKDGSYRLEEDNLFGCQDCQCDIGGSENNVCDKKTGKCACRPRISGRRCDKPLQTHYFPSLHQLQYELEDGRTPSDTPVRFGYDQSQFGDYSWRDMLSFRHSEGNSVTYIC